MATLLETIQDLCKRQNLARPAAAVGSSDPQVQQMIGLLEEEGTDLGARGGWEVLTNEATWQTLALEDQGAIADLADNGFDYIINETIWDRTSRLPVCGPLDAENWQGMKALQVSGPEYRYRMRGGHLLVNPAPPADHAWYFEYVTKNWILDVDGVTNKRRFTADSDVLLFPDDLCLQGLRWRWKKEKGLDYAEDFRTYEIQVKDAIGRSGGKPRLSMDSGVGGPVPGIWVSPWNTVS